LFGVIARTHSRTVAQAAAQQHELTLSRHYETLLLSKENQSLPNDLSSNVGAAMALQRLAHHLRHLLQSMGPDPSGPSSSSTDPADPSSPPPLDADADPPLGDWAVEREAEIARLGAENEALRRELGIDHGTAAELGWLAEEPADALRYTHLFRNDVRFSKGGWPPERGGPGSSFGGLGMAGAGAGGGWTEVNVGVRLAGSGGPGSGVVVSSMSMGHPAMNPNQSLGANQGMPPQHLSMFQPSPQQQQQQQQQQQMLRDQAGQLHLQQNPSMYDRAPPPEHRPSPPPIPIIQRSNADLHAQRGAAPGPGPGPGARRPGMFGQRGRGAGPGYWGPPERSGGWPMQPGPGMGGGNPGLDFNR
jgi:hypothetical protein